MPFAIVNEFVDGDIYRWSSLMAGALAGSLPLVILYAFFVEHYVSAMTGAVKEWVIVCECGNRCSTQGKICCAALLAGK